MKTKWKGERERERTKKARKKIHWKGLYFVHTHLYTYIMTWFVLLWLRRRTCASSYNFPPAVSGFFLVLLQPSLHVFISWKKRKKKNASTNFFNWIVETIKVKSDSFAQQKKLSKEGEKTNSKRLNKQKVSAYESNGNLSTNFCVFLFRYPIFFSASLIFQ